MTDIPLSKSDLARALGITRQTINSWIKQEKLVFDESGKMSIDEFNDQLGNHLHPVSKIKSEKYSPIFNDVDKSGEDTSLDYHAARTIREIAEAKTAEFKLSILKNEYVAKDDIEKIIFERGRQFRDGLLSVAARIAPLLAAETSISEIEALINEEHRNILDQFSKLPIVK